MKYKEISNLNKDELLAKLAEECENLRNFKFSHAISPIENPLKIKESRRQIAQIKTCLSMKHNLKNI